MRIFSKLSIATILIAFATSIVSVNSHSRGGSGLSILKGARIATRAATAKKNWSASKKIILEAKLDDAVKKDDWGLVQSLYKSCEIIADKDGFKFWIPRKCKPIILIQNSVSANARKVYHGLANDPQYELSRSWKVLEEDYFKNQPSQPASQLN